MNLTDQLRIAEYRVQRVAEQHDILHETAVSVMVGSGTERHGAQVTVWAAQPERPHPMAGAFIGGQVMPAIIPAKPVGVGSLRVDCGAQRAGSSVRSVSLTLPVTCERCLDRPGWAAVESLPEDVLTTNPRSRAIEPKAGR